MKTQTNRTILFEKVNKEKDTILSLIHMQNAKESLSDEEVQAIHRALEVSGFADFVEKFSPAVYMFLDPEKGIVRFTRECTDSRQIRISLGVMEWQNESGRCSRQKEIKYILFRNLLKWGISY